MFSAPLPLSINDSSRQQTEKYSDAYQQELCQRSFALPIPRIFDFILKRNKTGEWSAHSKETLWGGTTGDDSKLRRLPFIGHPPSSIPLPPPQQFVSSLSYSCAQRGTLSVCCLVNAILHNTVSQNAFSQLSYTMLTYTRTLPNHRPLLEWRRLDPDKRLGHRLFQGLKNPLL